MILKILLFARDKPFFFFPIAIFLIISIAVFLISVMAPLSNFAQNQLNLGEEAGRFVERFLFFPFFPFFGAIFYMFMEFWFNMFGNTRMVGLKDKPFTNALIEIFSKNHKRR